MKYLFLLIIVFIQLLFSSCDDIIENDLSGVSIILNNPTSNAILTEGDIFFWWDFLSKEENYHESYNLMIVSPNFWDIQQMYIDTLLSTNKFILNLNPGEYQCWVYAQNGSSYSDTTIHSFTVLDSSVSKMRNVISIYSVY